MKVLSEIIGLTNVDKEWLDQRPVLRVLGVNTTGLDHIDLDECKKRGIKVISLKGSDLFLSTITSTAEHTIGLIIALLRNYKTALNAPYKDREEYKGHTLSGKTICLIGGRGRIGKQVRKVCEALGMKVRIHDQEPIDNLLQDLQNSDIVTIHIPLDGNTGFFTKEMLNYMKPTAILINTSRDKVIEQGALLWALENKIIAGASVDFIDDKRLVEYAKEHNNLILTPHLGGCTFEDREKTYNFIKKLVENYIYENIRTT